MAALSGADMRVLTVEPMKLTGNDHIRHSAYRRLL
jgi:hypothetical protein